MPCRTPYVAIVNQLTIGPWTTQANYAIVWHALHICCRRHLYLQHTNTYYAHTYTQYVHNTRACSSANDIMAHLFYFPPSSFSISFFFSSLFHFLSPSAVIITTFLFALVLFAFFCWYSVELCIHCSCFVTTLDRWQFTRPGYCYICIYSK